jgi:hypothetical protein
MARERRRHVRSDEHGGGDDLHSQIVELLLDKVRDDPYPSTTHLDMLESIVQDDEVETYADVLMEKVRLDDYPSVDHLNRLMKLA